MVILRCCCVPWCHHKLCRAVRRVSLPTQQSITPFPASNIRFLTTSKLPAGHNINWYTQTVQIVLFCTSSVMRLSAWRHALLHGEESYYTVTSLTARRQVLLHGDEYYCTVTSITPRWRVLLQGDKPYRTLTISTALWQVLNYSVNTGYEPKCADCEYYWQPQTCIGLSRKFTTPTKSNSSLLLSTFF